MNTLKQIALIMTLSGIAACSETEQPSPFGIASSPADSGPAFADIDTDQNGLISRDEAESHALPETEFTAADVDRDGQLTASEFVRATRRETG